MKYRILRGGLRVVGWGQLSDVGSIVDDLPDDLAAQLTEQGIVQPLADRGAKVPKPDSKEEN